MVRFAVLLLFVVLTSSLVQVATSSYMLSQVCKSDTATWASCNPLEQATIQKVLEKCRINVLADARISTGRRQRRAQRRRLGGEQQEQEQEQKQHTAARRLASCPKPLSCAGHDPELLCFDDQDQLGCDSHFGGMDMVGKAESMAAALRACTQKAIASVVRPGMKGSKCEAAAEEILGAGCEQVAYLYM
jgi:hypothetical protein